MIFAKDFVSDSINLFIGLFQSSSFVALAGLAKLSCERGQP
jgi:hypothetical protein